MRWFKYHSIKCFCQFQNDNGVAYYNSIHEQAVNRAFAENPFPHILLFVDHKVGILYMSEKVLTLKTPRKPTSENVVCLCRLLNILANFFKPIFVYRQTVWTQIRLLLEEESDLGPYCLQK